MQHISIFVDDVARFVKALRQDLVTVQLILNAFGGALDLKVNYAKSYAIVIRGGEQDKYLASEVPACNLGSFSCKYLGLQLSTVQFTKADWQPCLGKVIAFLPPWQRAFYSDQEDWC